jgi:amino acid adenylation domain-containing protein
MISSSDPRSPADRSLPDGRDPLPCFPTSFAQQRIWFLHYLEPNVPTYNLPIALRFKGRLDVGALEESLNAIVRRHDALRTSFPVRQGNPVQVIAAPAHVALPEIDLRHLPAEAAAHEAARLAAAEGSRPFDLARGPVIRFQLLRIGEEDHVLVVTMHHIVSDGWSVDVFQRELAIFYEAFRLGKPSPLPELPIQYADYALWQRTWLQGQVLQAQLDYWKKQLAGAPPVLEIPIDRPRAGVRSSSGASHRFVLAPGLLQGLTGIARRSGATLFMTLLAAFDALLSRYTGQEDIAVGSPIAGRTQVETEDLIGFFVNTLVLRTDLSGDPTFTELLARVRETALSAYAHQDLPFERLVEELQPERSLSHTPLFQVLFQVSPWGQKREEFSELTVESFGVEDKIAKFDLSLRVFAGADRISSAFEYKTDLFDAETIRRMAGHWQALLAGIVANPDRPISEIPLLDEPERHRILVEWNATDVPYPRDLSVARLFEARAAAAPDAVALRHGKDRCTYAELNARANRLARVLRASGLTPGDPVGLCMERSIDMVVALLAIVKAGGAYVPLDPSYPRERLDFIVRDTGMSLLVTQRSLASRFPSTGPAVLVLEQEAGRIAAESSEDLGSSVDGAGLAYIMYTSGSTGMPKGVAVAHRGISRLVLGANYVTIGPDDVFLQVAPLSFDASTFEIWGPLLNGASCVLFPERIPTPADLRHAIHAHGVTILWLTASLFNTIVNADPKTLSGVRQLLIGGEALSVSHVRRALDSLPETRIINGYGPTEGTTFTCCYPIPRPVAESDTSIPIGRPISNTRVYVLDARGNPVPVGVAGELYVGGDGVALGYWKSPELTGERFVADPFTSDPAGRLYRTGDLVRYRPDGQIEFLGRLDKQVKIRGFRIEPGEIEAVLAQHPAVGASAVIAREDLPGDRKLVAYVVRRDGSRDPISDLRPFLASRLPEYMLPSLYVILNSLPLISSGKVDWRALPRPGVERSDDPSDSLPQDTLELVLLRIWEDVLSVRPIGIRDNFFELGGHSLLAVRLFAEIERAFGRNLPLATLFQAPTVEGLAGKLREEGWVAPWSSLVVIQGGHGRPPFLCIPGVGGNVLGFYDLARQLGSDQPVYGLQARGLDGKSEPLTRIEDMAAHYIREVRAVLPTGPFLLGGASFGGSVAFEMARQLERDGQHVALVALFDTFAPGRGGGPMTVQRLRRRAGKYADRIAYHAKNLFFGSSRSNYIRSKSRTLRRRIRSRIWQMVYSSYRGRSKPLPPALQDVREAGYLANKEYVPQTYPGRVTLFRAGIRAVDDSDRPDMGWGRLALGGVEIREVPGDHVNMLLRPQVGLLAEQLRDCIDQAIGAEPPASQEKTPGSITA